MPLWIKICGITHAEAAQAAAEAGADAVGFVFHAPSPRNLTPEAAAALAQSMPAGLETVAVTLRPPLDLIPRLLETLRPDWLQGERDDPALRHLPTGCRPLPVWRSGASEQSVPPGPILFEGPQSGRGQTADWALAADLAGRTRLVLAGGLDVGNARAALRRVRPYGLDVSSGVESRPGLKCPEKIHAFVRAVRTAEREVESDERS